MRFVPVLIMAAALSGCIAPAEVQRVQISTAVDVPKQGAPAGGAKRIAYNGAGGFTLPDGATVAADPGGGFRLPNGSYVTPDAAGGVVLPNGSRCVSDGARGYLCP
jgi:hypothetical protein